MTAHSEPTTAPLLRLRPDGTPEMLVLGSLENGAPRYEVTAEARAAWTAGVAIRAQAEARRGIQPPAVFSTADAAAAWIQRREAERGRVEERTPMRVLIACEYSGIVRDAFIRRGYDAMSCDLLPTEQPGPHYQGDVRDVLGDGWDLMIAHPPCTDLAVSGARWFGEKRQQQADALAFVRLLLAAPIPRIALENPVSIISTHVRPADQTIQPWMFGHGETKATCLWLKNLPRLVPTNRVDGREPRVHMLPPSADRWKERSRTYPGIADAMAAQWGAALLEPIQSELWEAA